MRKIIILLFAFSAITFISVAQERVPAQKGSLYGSDFAQKKILKPSEFSNKVIDSNKVAVQVKGTVVDVCPKKGCWMNVAMENGDTLFVKMKDYAFFVPDNMKGKEILLNGQAYIETTSVMELKHYAEDAKKPQAEIDAITEPQQKARFTASGIKVLN